MIRLVRVRFHDGHFGETRSTFHKQPADRSAGGGRAQADRSRILLRTEMTPGGIHLAVDAVGTRFGGAATVLTDFIAAAVANPRIHRLTLFVSPREQRMFELPAADRVYTQDVLANGGFKRILWLIEGLPRAVQKFEAQALYCLGNGGVGPPNIATAVLIQQSIPFYREGLQRLGIGDRLRMTAIREVMRLSCRRAELVVVQSKAMRDRIESDLGVDGSKLLVSHPSARKRAPRNADDPQLTRMRDAPRSCRLLYVGNARPYKNLDFLLRALYSARARGAQWRLFMTCPPSHPLCAPPFVVGLGTLQPEALWAAYELADVLVMPSLVETVGLPMLEAASAGTPVLAADRPYARETCGDGALYFDPQDIADFQTKLDRLMTDHELRLNLIGRGRVLSAKREKERPYERLVDELVALASNGRSGPASRAHSGRC